MKIHPDFNDFIASLNNHGVEYVIVGSFALAFYAQPRATGRHKDLADLEMMGES